MVLAIMSLQSPVLGRDELSNVPYLGNGIDEMQLYAQNTWSSSNTMGDRLGYAFVVKAVLIVMKSNAAWP